MCFGNKTVGYAVGLYDSFLRGPVVVCDRPVVRGDVLVDLVATGQLSESVFRRFDRC